MYILRNKDISINILLDTKKRPILSDHLVKCTFLCKAKRTFMTHWNRTVMVKLQFPRHNVSMESGVPPVIYIKDHNDDLQ